MFLLAGTSSGFRPLPRIWRSSTMDGFIMALARSALGRSLAATWPASGGDHAEPAEPRRPVALVLARLSKPPEPRLASRRADAIMAVGAPPAAPRWIPSPLHAKRSAEDLPLPHATIFDAQPSRALCSSSARINGASRRLLPSRTLLRQHHSTEPLTTSPQSTELRFHFPALAPVASSLLQI
nr:unnamed protein product [Digitaria exilis]